MRAERGEHGVAAYNQGCRCSTCRSAQALRVGAHRRAGRPPGPGDPALPFAAVQDGPASWRALAACAGLPTALFYSGAPSSVAVAKATCAGCPVHAECLCAALRQERHERHPFGVRGGLSASERAVLLEPRPSSAAG